MARPIYCTGAGEAHEAEVIIGQLSDGTQTPLCAAHMYDYCQAFVQAVDEAEAEAAAIDLESRLAGTHAPVGPDPIDQADAADIADATGILITDDELDRARATVAAEAEAVDGASAFPATAQVVRKHTSKSRRAYDARQAAKAAEAAQVAAPAAAVAPDPSDAGTDDAGEAEPID